MSDAERPSGSNRIAEANRQHFNTRQHVFREGEVGDSAFIVVDGTVAIYRLTEEGEQVLATLAKGAMFGEMALIEARPRMAMARAAATTTVVVIPKALFSSKVAKCDPFVRCLVGSYAKLIRSLV